MAHTAEVRFRTRQEALEGFAKTLGVHPARDPVPEWWDAFEAWFQEARAEPGLRDPNDANTTSIGLRMEAELHEETS